MYTEIAEIPATTWEGLRCKARVASRPNALDEVAESIVGDVLAMGPVS
jgi:hypothetical protein